MANCGRFWPRFHFYQAIRFMPRWLLPEAVADVLPSEARRMEELRRTLLDLYRSYGYELVMPPLVEHLDSLLVGSGSDLGLKTFQLVDQLSGRTLGVRADITPQVARIDAHLLGRQGVTRLCYAGSVLHTRPSSLNGTREPVHIGAELYGAVEVQADLEILELVIRSLALAGAPSIRVDLTHAGVLAGLLGDAQVNDRQALLGLLLTKDLPGLKVWLKGSGLTASQAEAIAMLPRLYGPAAQVLEQAQHVVAPFSKARDALDELRAIATSSLWTDSASHGAGLAIDLADLRGYHYYTGVSFAAYVAGQPDAVVRGGRYDNIGKVFGRARPATGFSIELRELASIQVQADESVGLPAAAIRAPWSADLSLRQAIAALRAQGEIVIQSLPGHEHDHQEFSCDRELQRGGNGWQVVRLGRSSH